MIMRHYWSHGIGHLYSHHRRDVSRPCDDGARNSIDSDGDLSDHDDPKEDTERSDIENQSDNADPTDSEDIEIQLDECEEGGYDSADSISESSEGVLTYDAMDHDDWEYES
jgi:hypothetical protein